MAANRPGALAFAWCGVLLFASSLVIFLHVYLVRWGHPATDGLAMRDVLLNVALFTVFALHHSLLARSGVKALLARVVSRELQRSIYTWCTSILFIGVCLLWRPLPGELYHVEGALALLGYAIQIVGVALTGRASSALGVLDLAGVRSLLDARQGLGAAHGPLHTSGLFGFVRHPLYFAWILVVFGTPHMTMTRVVFAVVSTAYLALAIPFEERSLLDIFGDRYREYRQKVRWRLVPGVY